MYAWVDFQYLRKACNYLETVQTHTHHRGLYLSYDVAVLNI